MDYSRETHSESAREKQTETDIRIRSRGERKYGEVSRCRCIMDHVIRDDIRSQCRNRISEDGEGNGIYFAGNLILDLT